jgi:hypothetical protein
MLARLRNGGPRVNWAVLISAASLVLALFGGLWAAVQSQVNTVKELTANDRQAIRRQLEENDRVTANIRSNKVDIERYTSELNAIRDSASADREDIRRHTDAIGVVVDDLRSTKLDITRFDQLLNKLLSSGEVEARDAALQKQIDKIDERLIRLEQHRRGH